METVNEETFNLIDDNEVEFYSVDTVEAVIKVFCKLYGIEIPKKTELAEAELENDSANIAESGTKSASSYFKRYPYGAFSALLLILVLMGIFKLGGVFDTESDKRQAEIDQKSVFNAGNEINNVDEKNESFPRDLVFKNDIIIAPFTLLDEFHKKLNLVQNESGDKNLDNIILKLKNACRNFNAGLNNTLNNKGYRVSSTNNNINLSGNVFMNEFQVVEIGLVRHDISFSLNFTNIQLNYNSKKFDIGEIIKQDIILDDMADAKKEIFNMILEKIKRHKNNGKMN